MGIETGLAAIGTFLGAGAASATAVGALATGLGASSALSAYSGIKSASAQKDASNQAAANAKATAEQAAQANNRANQKTPDGMALLSANQAAAGAGQSGTMLTGSSGIDPSLLQLGKTTLLGGGG